ncbi:protein NDUFAF4 homolog [Culicoides brevitarsis]|uniref:protein NDUFAF4 homolog n=1 Tax=Culicoides brevitarsis TaxID=469753 RepID=UPI00307CB195
MEILKRLGGLVVRAAQRFNAESRAHKVIDKIKAGDVRPAPKYEAAVRQLEQTLEQNPGLIEKLSKKDAPLDDRLRQVYVTSQREIIEPEQTSDRPLPLSRTTPEEFDFGYLEPQKVPRGKIAMRDVLQMLNEHQMDPEEGTAAKFSEKYKVKESYIEDILKHYKVLSVHISDPKMKKLTPQKELPLVQGVKEKDLLRNREKNREKKENY